MKMANNIVHPMEMGLACVFHFLGPDLSVSGLVGVLYFPS